MKKTIKSIIIMILILVVYLGITITLYNIHAEMTGAIFSCFGAFYVGRLLVKLADWLMDNTEK